MKLEGQRLILRPWRDDDRAPLAAMLADPEVMWDWERTFDRAESDAKLDRYQASILRHGYGRFPVLDKRDGGFLGYCGIMQIMEDQPLAPGVEIGWRFVRTAWGHGYASEAARICLKHGFEQCGFTEILAQTRHDNIRSENVMKRLDMTFLPHRSWDADGHRQVVYTARR
jgi:RimJ/RimL family protein N-acetyltransferase